jgi:spermidine/putrescine transport system permease protein
MTSQTGSQAVEQSPAHPAPTARPPGPATPRRAFRLPGFTLAVPAWLWLIGFFLAPVSLVLWYSFGEKPGLFGTHSNKVLSLDRYGEALEPDYLPTFVNTLRIAVVGTLICLLIAVPFAYWLAVKVDPRWRGVVLGLVMVPYWTNFLVRTLGWTVILSPDGWVSGLLQDIGLRDAPLAVLYTRGAVQLGVVYNYLALMILPVFVAFDRIDPALREASRDLGANRWLTFRRSACRSPRRRRRRPGARVHPADGRLRDGDGARRREGHDGRPARREPVPDAQNWALGSAMAVGASSCSSAITVAFFAIAWTSLRAVVRARSALVVAGAWRVTAGPAPRRAAGPALARGRTPRTSRCTCGACWCSSSCSCRSSSSSSSRSTAGRLLLVWDHFGTGAYRRALSDTSIKSAVGRLPARAAGASVIATVLGTLAGVALARRGGRWTVPFLAILGLTLVTPEIVDAVSLLPWFVWLGTDAHLSLFSNGLARLVIGHSLFASAVVVFIVRARVEGLEETLEEAAADLYATPWRRFRDITVPLMAPAVLAGALMAFTLSLDNTIISAFVQVSGSTPWPVYVFSGAALVAPPGDRRRVHADAAADARRASAWSPWCCGGPASRRATSRAR